MPRARVTPAAAGGAGRYPSTRVCPSLSDKPPPSPREQPIPARSSQVGGAERVPLAQRFRGKQPSRHRPTQLEGRDLGTSRQT